MVVKFPKGTKVRVIDSGDVDYDKYKNTVGVVERESAGGDSKWRSVRWPDDVLRGYQIEHLEEVMTEKMLNVPESKVREAMDSYPYFRGLMETIFGEQLAPEFPSMRSGMVYEHSSRGYYLSVSANEKTAASNLPPFVMGCLTGGRWSTPKDKPEDYCYNGFRPFTGLLMLRVENGNVVEAKEVG